MRYHVEPGEIQENELRLLSAHLGGVIEEWLREIQDQQDGEIDLLRAGGDD
jgi:hypothetical protein